MLLTYLARTTLFCERTRGQQYTRQHIHNNNKISMMRLRILKYSAEGSMFTLPAVLSVLSLFIYGMVNSIQQEQFLF